MSDWPPFPETAVSRRWLLGGLLASVAAPALAEAPLTSPLPQRRAGQTGTAPPRKVSAASADALIAAARLGGTVGYVVADARTGSVLEAANAATGLPPASVAKTLTTLYALETLGPGYRFATRLIATGPVQGGRIAGDLVLAGGGDPTLSTDRLAAMASALKARGITGVAGRFLVFGGALPAIERICRDQPDQVGYNPAISGLNLNFNRVYFEWRRGESGYDISLDARSELYRPAVQMATMQIANRTAPLYTYAAADGVDSWSVAGSALGNEGSRWLPVRQPALYTGQAFRGLAGAQGITLSAPEVSRTAPRGDVLVTDQSEPLTEVLRDMLRFSTNMTAEIVGLTASAKRGGAVSSLAASARRMADWLAAAHGLRGLNLVDHSGLGAASRVSPAAMAQALVVAGKSGALRALMRDYPARDAAGNAVEIPGLGISAKTGTLNFVSALAGYVSTPGQTELVFAVFCADPARRDRVPMGEREAPEGGPAWTKRARTLQQGLITRWVAVYGG